MASYAGNKNLKQDKNAKGKYQSLNINNIYRGSSVSQPKILVSRQHGLQSLGKVTKIRRGTLSSNPSDVKSESSEFETNSIPFEEPEIEIIKEKEKEIVDEPIIETVVEDVNKTKSWSSVTKTKVEKNVTPETAENKNQDGHVLKPQNISKWVDGAVNKTKPELPSKELSDFERERLIKKQGAHNTSTMFGPTGLGANGELQFIPNRTQNVEISNLMNKDNVPYQQKISNMSNPTYQTKEMSKVTDDGRISILKKEDITKNLKQPNQLIEKSGWAKPTGHEIDYTEALVFSDDEDKNNSLNDKNKVQQQTKKDDSQFNKEPIMVTLIQKPHQVEQKPIDMSIRRNYYQNSAQSSEEIISDEICHTKKYDIQIERHSNYQNKIKPLLQTNIQKPEEDLRNFTKMQLNDNERKGYNRQPRPNVQRKQHDSRKMYEQNNTDQIYHANIPPLLNFNNDPNWNRNDNTRVKNMNSHIESYSHQRRGDFFSDKKHEVKKEKFKMASNSYSADNENESYDNIDESQGNDNLKTCYDTGAYLEEESPVISPVKNWKGGMSKSKIQKDDNVHESNGPIFTSLKTGNVWQKSDQEKVQSHRNTDKIDSNEKSEKPVTDLREKLNKAKEKRNSYENTETKHESLDDDVRSASRPYTAGNRGNRGPRGARNVDKGNLERVKVPNINIKVPWTIQNEKSMDRINDNVLKSNDTRMHNRRANDKERRSTKNDVNYEEKRIREDGNRTNRFERNKERTFEKNSDRKYDENKYQKTEDIKNTKFNNSEKRNERYNKDTHRNPIKRDTINDKQFHRNNRDRNQSKILKDKFVEKVSQQVPIENEDQLETWSSCERLNESIPCESDNVASRAQYQNLSNLNVEEESTSPIPPMNKTLDAPMPTTNVWQCRTEEKRQKEEEDNKKREINRNEQRSYRFEDHHQHQRSGPRMDNRSFRNYDQHDKPSRYRNRDSRKEDPKFIRDNKRDYDIRPTQQPYQAPRGDDRKHVKGNEIMKDSEYPNKESKKRNDRKSSNSDDINEDKLNRAPNYVPDNRDDEKLRRRHKDQPVYSVQKHNRNEKRPEDKKSRRTKDTDVQSRDNRENGDSKHKNVRYSKQNIRSNTKNVINNSSAEKSENVTDSISKNRPSISKQNSVETMGEIWETASESSNRGDPEIKKSSDSKKESKKNQRDGASTTHKSNEAGKNISKNTSHVFHVSSIEPENPDLINNAIETAQNKVKSKASDAIRDYNEKINEGKKRQFTSIDINNYAHVYIIDDKENDKNHVTISEDDDDDGFHEVISKRALKLNKQQQAEIDAEAQLLINEQTEAANKKKNNKRKKRDANRRNQTYDAIAQSETTVKNNSNKSNRKGKSRGKSDIVAKKGDKRNARNPQNKISNRSISPFNMSFPPIPAPLPSVNAWTTPKKLFETVEKVQPRAIVAIDSGVESLPTPTDNVQSVIENKFGRKSTSSKDKSKNRKDKSDLKSRRKVDRHDKLLKERPIRYSENRESSIREEKAKNIIKIEEPLKEIKTEDIVSQLPTSNITTSHLGSSEIDITQYIYEAPPQDIKTPKIMNDNSTLNKDLAHIWNTHESSSITNNSSSSIFSHSKTTHESMPLNVYSQSNALMDNRESTSSEVLQAMYGDDESNSNVCKVMPQQQPSDVTAGGVPIAINSKSEATIGNECPPESTSVAAAAAATIRSSVSVSEHSVNSIASLIPQDISSIPLPREQQNLILPQSTALSYNFTIPQSTSNESRFIPAQTASQHNYGYLPQSQAQAQLPIGASLNAQINSNNPQLNILSNSMFQPEMFLQNNQNFPYRTHYNQNTSAPLIQLPKSNTNYLSQVTNPLIKSNSSTQHNTAIPSNYGNSQPNPVYITNQMAFDQMIGNNTQRMSNSQILMTNTQFHRPPPSNTLHAPPSMPIHPNSNNNAQSSFYSQQQAPYYHSHNTNTSSLQAPIHQVTSPPSQYQIFGGTQQNRNAQQQSMQSNNSSYMYQRSIPKSAQPIHPQINHSPMRDNETTYYAQPSYLVENVKPSSVNHSYQSQGSYKGRSNAVPFTSRIDTSAPPPPITNSIYDSTKEEQKRQKEDYINSLSEMIAPSNEPKKINKAVSIEPMTSN